jgi:hypothetical protein
VAYREPELALRYFSRHYMIGIRPYYGKPPGGAAESELRIIKQPVPLANAARVAMIAEHALAALFFGTRRHAGF